MNPFSRIIGVFFSPRPTFASIAERPSWIAPLLLMAILATGVGALLNTKMNWNDYIRHKAEENPRFSQLTEEQKDQAVAGQVRFWSYFSYTFGVLGVTFSALFFSLLYWGSFNLLRGAGLRYIQSGIRYHHACISANSRLQRSGADHLAAENLRRRRPGETCGHQPQGVLAG
jgi:hypothetical protein